MVWEISGLVVWLFGGVGGFVGWSSQHNVEVTGKVVIDFFLDVDGDAALNLFVGLEIDVGPAGVVDELVQSGLQTFENGFVGACNLVGINTDFALNFLSLNGLNGKQAEKKYDESDKSCLHFEMF